MSRKVNDSYEYKEATMRRAMEYSSFGWLIGNNSQHYSKKEKEDVVTLRRDFTIGANPTISDCEKDYLKLEKGKIPAKYRSHVFLKFLGKLLFILLTIVFCIVGVLASTVGLYDGIKTTNKVKALYNCAVENNLVSGDPVLTMDDLEGGNGITDGYLRFVSCYPTLDSFAELVDFSHEKATDEKLFEDYKKSLFYFGVIDEMSDEAVFAVDKTAVKTEDGNYTEQKLIETFLDPIRKILVNINFDSILPAELPVWLNSLSMLGGFCLFVFLVILLSVLCTKKKRKLKRRKRCAVIMKDCVKQASEALYNIKTENKELMTKQDEELFGIESVMSKVVSSDSDDYD